MADKIACIGAGNVGRAWATVFARAGYAVDLYDAGGAPLKDRTLPMIRQSLIDQHEAGFFSENPEDAFARVTWRDSLEEAVDGAIYVQESIAENVDVKKTVFAAIDAALASNAIAGSSTSAIPGAEFMGGLKNGDRCLVAHPVNPPSIIPLVEVCGSPWTSEATIKACCDLMAALGQKPVILKKPITGFLLNRLQFALVGEAMHLVGEGYCEPEDIDAVLTDGLALRWAFRGPFETMHLNASEGVEGYMEVLGDMVRSVTADLNVGYDCSDETVRHIHHRQSGKVPVSEIPTAQEARDRDLLAIRSFLNGRRKTI